MSTLTSPAPAFLAALSGEGFGIVDGPTASAADGAAFVMLGVIFFVMTMVALFAWTMVRRSRQPDPTLEYLASVNREQDPPSEGNPKAAGETWERPPDWWKK